MMIRRLFTIIYLFIVGSCLAQQPVDVQHYSFQIGLSDNSDSITGKTFVTVKFPGNTSELQLDLVSVHDNKGMHVFSVKEGDDVLKSKHAEDVLTIALNRPAKAGEVRTFGISYGGIPDDGLIISKNKFGDRTFFADNWPNRAHHWIPCVDRPDDKASFEFIVRAPEEYSVISNGLLIPSDADSMKDRTSGEESAQDLPVWHYREDIPLSTKVMVIGVARFAIRQFHDSPIGIPVSAWVYPQDSTEGFYDYGVAPKIVKFFSGYIAPYPYKKLANVQSKTIFGGMENASAIFYAEGSVTGNRKWEDVMAHEIAHQWFGDMVSEKSFAHLWLSEGFATYLTDLYIENTYGKDSANRRLKKEREEVIRFSKTTKNAVVDSSNDLMSLLNANSYQKGAWVLHMLRDKVGDSLFRKIIQNYYRQYKGSNAETRDFERVAEETSVKELKLFFDQWLYRPGIPQIKVSWHKGSRKIYITVEQKTQRPFDFDLPVGIISVKGVAEKPVILHITRQKQSFSLKGRNPLTIILDPSTRLLFRGSISKDE